MRHRPVRHISKVTAPNQTRAYATGAAYDQANLARAATGAAGSAASP